MAGYGRDKFRDVFGFLALVEQRRHLAEPAGAAFLDRVEDEFLATGGGRDLLAHADVEVRADAADRLRPRERVAVAARAGEEFAALLLVGGEVNTADADARLVVAVEGQDEGGHGQTEGEQDDHADDHQAPAGGRFGVQRVARAARPTADREEEHGEADEQPEEHEDDDHAGGNISGASPGSTPGRAPLRP